MPGARNENKTYQGIVGIFPKTWHLIFPPQHLCSTIHFHLQGSNIIMVYNEPFQLANSSTDDNIVTASHSLAFFVFCWVLSFFHPLFLLFLCFSQSSFSLEAPSFKNCLFFFQYYRGKKTDCEISLFSSGSPSFVQIMTSFNFSLIVGRSLAFPHPRYTKNLLSEIKLHFWG